MATIQFCPQFRLKGLEKTVKCKQFCLWDKLVQIHFENQRGIENVELFHILVGLNLFPRSRRFAEECYRNEVGMKF